MWRRTGNPESRQFGSFSSPVKTAIASTRHCSGISEFGSDYLSNVNTCVYEPSATEIRSNKKFCFAIALRRDKISTCDNITICSGSCLRMVVTAPIAPELERYPCLVRRRDSICAQTVLDSQW
jgi:hypothetical protein